jgi:prepilin-type N-terminal cleavage/methylation domain-containing protein
MQPQIVILNKKGTSLIEILVSLALVSIVFTGLLQSSILAVKTNVQNLVRDEAVSIAEQQMNVARNTSFDALVTAPTLTINRNFRGITNFPFGTNMNVTPLDNPNNNKQVAIAVTWSRQGVSYTHNITTVVRRPGT